MTNLIDWSQLHDLSGDDPDFERELLALFIEDTQQTSERLVSAFLQQDFEAIREAAHHIKGASANVGATTISNDAKAIEMAAQEKQPDNMAVLIESIKAQVAELQQALNE